MEPFIENICKKNFELKSTDSCDRHRGKNRTTTNDVFGFGKDFDNCVTLV